MMTRQKSPSRPDGSPPSADQFERLIDVITDLTEQVKVLRIAIDDLREECGWAARQIVNEDTYRPVMHITSLPKDPCDPDFGKRINRVKQSDFPTSDADSEKEKHSNGQGELW